MKKIVLLLGLLVFIAGCTENAQPEESTVANAEETVIVKDNIELSATRGYIEDKVSFVIKDLTANKSVQLVWIAYDGKYLIEDLYVVKGAEYTEQELVLAEGVANADGQFSGEFTIPDGFGWDHTIQVKQNETVIGQTNYNVIPEFEISPTSGPPGTEITITAKGIGASTYMRNWQLMYDNKYTGILSAVSTNGTAIGKIRAAGLPGEHLISIRTGYLGMPYINHAQSPYKGKPEPDFIFTITDEAPVGTENYVEPIPVAADGGVVMPELVNKEGVHVELSITEGTVGQPVTLNATGLPKNKDVELVWHTMVGSRVSGLGFEGKSNVLDSLTSDTNGELNYEFKVPDDLGGIPHRVDIVIDGEIFGQSYLRILPTIVEFSPKSGPVGTKVKVILKGGGWTEFDNAYYQTYDNAYVGYMCAFNSQGTLEYELIASGEVGMHFIDLYPGIYRWAQTDTDPALIPQLTYQQDHPGSAMPAIRLAFEITEK